MSEERGLSSPQQVGKRLFDIIFALIGLILTGWLIILAWLMATMDTGMNGFFTQERVGRGGRLFKIMKIRTMRDRPGHKSTVTTIGDPRVTTLGRFFRKTKIDELPQLLNVLKGQMSFVGPRPDVPGYADLLEGEDRIILTVRPGITGPASLRYRHEEQLLEEQPDPEAYNRTVIFPDKVRINREYVRNYNFFRDLKCILQTLCERR